jgi:hypothetical protein
MKPWTKGEVVDIFDSGGKAVAKGVAPRDGPRPRTSSFDSCR